MPAMKSFPGVVKRKLKNELGPKLEIYNLFTPNTWLWIRYCFEMFAEIFTLLKESILKKVLILGNLSIRVWTKHFYELFAEARINTEYLDLWRQ